MAVAIHPRIRLAAVSPSRASQLGSGGWSAFKAVSPDIGWDNHVFKL
ncbi:MAG: hypothetical protein QXG08_01220 [Candidatus Methanomethyliaceae archaeon]